MSWTCGEFTVRCVVFPNPSDLTINNLLSENYTTQYIQRRFTVGGKSYLSDLSWYSVSINDIRLIDSYKGVDGLTNSFAAAIWTIEMIMEWTIVSGRRIDFFNPITGPSFQSILGQAPNFAPSAIYYGLLFAINANNYAPYIIRPTMAAKASQSIKVYYLDYWSYYGVLILNKDTSTAANGEVEVIMTDKTGLHCIYLSASNLSATSGFSYGGYSFISNNSIPQGLFTQVLILPDPATSNYFVPVNYSQAVYCRTVVATGSNYRSFPRWNPSDSGEEWPCICLALLFFLSFII